MAKNDQLYPVPKHDSTTHRQVSFPGNVSAVQSRVDRVTHHFVPPGKVAAADQHFPGTICMASLTSVWIRMSYLCQLGFCLFQHNGQSSRVGDMSIISDFSSNGRRVSNVGRRCRGDETHLFRSNSALISIALSLQISRSTVQLSEFTRYRLYSDLT